jgi:hypothetical protein
MDATVASCRQAHTSKLTGKSGCDERAQHHNKPRRRASVKKMSKTNAASPIPKSMG